MKEKLQISGIFPVSAKRLYDAWLNSREHSKFTGSKAEIRPVTGSKFSAWDKYITGSNLKLQPYGRIVQNWRTTDFPSGALDSRLEILFEKVKNGTRVTFVHTQIPEGQARGYKNGWKDYYLSPMKIYFKPID